MSDPRHVTVTVYRQDNHELAVSVTGTLVSEESENGLTKITVSSDEGEQFVQFGSEHYAEVTDAV